MKESKKQYGEEWAERGAKQEYEREQKVSGGAEDYLNEMFGMIPSIQKYVIDRNSGLNDPKSKVLASAGRLAIASTIAKNANYAKTAATYNRSNPTGYRDEVRKIKSDRNKQYNSYKGDPKTKQEVEEFFQKKGYEIINGFLNGRKK